MMKPICVPYQRFLRPKKNGFYFLEGKPDGGEGIPWDGKSGKSSIGWTPYKLWEGDLWECPDCKSQIVVGVGRIPVGEHYERDFKHMVEVVEPTLFVKDC